LSLSLFPQPLPWLIHGRDVVSSLLYAVFYARLSSPSQPAPPVAQLSCRHSSLIRHQTIAAACIFLATKTEECGRKLRDVARVCQSKAKGIDVRDIPESGPVRVFLVYPFSRYVLGGIRSPFFFVFAFQEIDEVSSQILAAEEVLLEALCFDFVIDSPHADLVELFATHDATYRLQDYAWSIAHDSSVPRPSTGLCSLSVTHLIFRYRTPLCVLYPPKIIATACYILSQRIVDGPHSLSLDARVAPSAPSASLPTPPTHKPSSPDASRIAIEFFGLEDSELLSVTGTYVVSSRIVIIKSVHVIDALAILLNFYEYQAALGLANYLDPITDVCLWSLLFASGRSSATKVQPPTVASYQMRLYPSSADPAEFGIPASQSHPSTLQNSTPISAHGGSRTPAQTSSAEEALEKTD
jgi:hypothetical protein